METKFTKGKWNLTESKRGNYFMNVSGFYQFVKIYSGKTEKSKETQKANALLISKAPEMFEMLVKVRQAILSEDYTRMLCESQSIKELLKEATEL